MKNITSTTFLISFAFFILGCEKDTEPQNISKTKSPQENNISEDTKTEQKTSPEPQTEKTSPAISISEKTQAYKNQPNKAKPALNPEGTAGPSEATILSPNGRESLVVGKPYQIRWEANGFTKINITLEEEGYKRGTVAKGILVSEKQYFWTPEATHVEVDGHFLKLKVVLSDAQSGVVLDESDKSFSVKMP